MRKPLHLHNPLLDTKKINRKVNFSTQKNPWKPLY